MKDTVFRNITHCLAVAALLGAAACTTADKSPETITADAIDCIMTRSTVRDFAGGGAIGADTLDVILRAGMAAPSAMNRQPWRFAVVEGEPLAALMDSMDYGGGKRGAALAIVVCGDSAAFMDGAAAECWVQDCAAATENILLAAHALGLGAGWNGCYPDAARCESVKSCLALTDNLVPLSVVLVGRPAAPAVVKDKWNPANIIRVK